jgi:hypothetical protein
MGRPERRKLHVVPAPAPEPVTHDVWPRYYRPDAVVCGRVGEAVFSGMLACAMAQTEACGVLACDGRIELSAKYEPSGELRATFNAEVPLIIGVLGWAVPLSRPQRWHRMASSSIEWPTRGIGTRGHMGAN